MSPLLGSYGGSSEYAFRGTIDDWPDDFSFDDQIDINPGEIVTSNTETITGVNNRCIVRVSAGASVSIDGGSYVIPTEESPVFIENNQTISIKIPTTSGSTSDFNKKYSTSISIGKKSQIWSVTTKLIDQDPIAVTFTSLTEKEIGIAYTSNEVTISGLESGFAFPASIISGSGTIVKNSGSPVGASTVTNGDRVYLRLISPLDYTNYPIGSGTKTTTTGIQIANYSTSWSISTREPDLLIEPFEFDDVNNVNIESVYTATSVNTSGVTTTITGADPGIPMVALVTDCELRVEQPAVGGGFSIRRDFGTQNTVAYNGDRLTARVTTGSEYSKTKIGIVTVSNQTAQFITTTRPRPIDTIPSPFQFTDLTNQSRGVVIESNEITLTGMSTFSDQGVASITTGSAGGNGQFKVTRGTTVVNDYGTANANVQQGDKIKLRLTSSPNSNVTRSVTFSVAGTDTSLNLDGISGTQQDVWNVNTATRQCEITSFSLETVDDADPNKLYSKTFVATGFDTDCGMIVSTSNSNSYLSVSGSSLTNNIPVSPGTTVTVYMTSGDYFATRTTDVTISNGSSSISPTRSSTATWTINTVDDTRNTTLTMSSNKTSIQLGQSFTLTWTAVNASSVNAFGGDEFFPTTTTGTATITPTLSGSLTYSLTVLGPPSAANYNTQIAASPQGVTATVNITVTEDTTPDSFTMDPSSRSNQTLGAYSSFIAKSSTDSSKSVTGISPGLTITASATSPTNNDVYFTVNGSGRNTSASVSNDDVLELYVQNSTNYLTAARGTLTIGTNSQTVTTTSSACVSPTSTTSISSGVDVTMVAAKGFYENGSPFTGNVYRSKSGSNLNSECKSSVTSEYNNQYTSGGSYTIPADHKNVTQAFVAVIGGGGGGGKDTNDSGGGGGGGASSYATIAVSPGGRFTITIGRGGSGATSNGAGSNGGDSFISYTGSPSSKLISAAGGSAGGRNAGGNGGSAFSQSGSTSVSGGNGQPGQPTSGGYGGSAALLGSGKANPGNPISGCSGGWSGGAGGGGGSVPAFSIPSSGNTGVDATCSNTGRNGTTAGGGGGGGARSGNGGNGADGRARIQYTGTLTSPTWAELIDKIVSVYTDKAKRPPFLNEITDNVSSFRNNSTQTLSEFQTQLETQLTDSSYNERAISITDSCGNSL